MPSTVKPAPILEESNLQGPFKEYLTYVHKKEKKIIIQQLIFMVVDDTLTVHVWKFWQL